MAELLRTHPLEAWSAAFGRLPAPVGSAVEPFVAMVDVRLGTVGAEASAALGVDLPTTPNTWVPADPGRAVWLGPAEGLLGRKTGRAVWLGPDEWLLSSTTEAPEDLEARVRAAVVPLGGAATDVSAQRIGLRLTGTRVRDLLAKGCSIDLHPRVFARGSSAQTALGQ